MTRATAAQRLQAAWLRRGPLSWLLRPVSLLYGAVWRLRALAYAQGWRARERLPVPVIVVGNVVAGGAGKTPTVIALVEHLRGRGIAAGVVSRGYGSDGGDDDGRPVLADSDPHAVGDEPLLIRRRTGAPVFVGRRRAQAARRLLAENPQVQVIVCDDGLQHLALARDIEVCVFDDRGTGNGLLLPAGPLREPWPRRCDLVLHTGDRPAFGGFRGQRSLADDAVQADGERVALGSFAHSGEPVHAVAGIASPETFFGMLRARGLVLANTRALPDHAAFSADELSGIGSEATLLCTEKDAAKLWRLRPRALAVPLAFAPEPGFFNALDRLLDARLSSASRAPARPFNT